MNTVQKYLFTAGLLLMALFVFIKPIRQQNPVYIPMIESVSKFMQAPLNEAPLAPDNRKNLVAAGVTAGITILGLYCLEETHPVPGK